MDVKTTFLHDGLKEELYMEQPKHYIKKVKSVTSLLLKKFFLWSKIMSYNVVLKV